jgi:uncharacterized membrane protein
MMEDYHVARVLHVLGVVLWIGGVAFVTLVLLPAVRRSVDPAARVGFFERVEAGFASQAKLTTVITGASGFYLVHRLGAWDRFADPAFWWMHAMLALWLLFTVMLFVLEPLWLHRWFIERAGRDPDGTLAIVVRLHRVLLAAALITAAGAVAGSHGWRFGA